MKPKLLGLLVLCFLAGKAAAEGDAVKSHSSLPEQSVAGAMIDRRK